MIEDRSEWLAERKRGIGGSDMQHVFSAEPYGCARRLWYDKRGEPMDFPEQESAVMQRGTRLEDLVADLYAERTGRALERRKAIFHPEEPWMRVNVDRVIVGDGLVTEQTRALVAELGPGALEIKTHNDWMFRQVKREGLMIGHLLQLQHALFVTGYRWGAYAILHPDSWSLLHFDVPRDDALIAAMRVAAARLWRQVEHGPIPDQLPTIDRRCRTCPWRTTCRGEEIVALPGDFDREMELERDDTLTPLLADYREAKQLADEAGETLEIVQAAIKRHMGERRAAECDAGRVYFAPQVSMRIDTKALREKNPSLAKSFEKPSTSRPLRVHTY